jgi:nucleoside-diphosphate-sugar epimerase
VRVFVTGATGVMGTSVVSALQGAGHVVTGLARSDRKADELRARDVEPVFGTFFDEGSMAEAFAGHDVVCNMATNIPVGLSGMRPGAWRVNDRIRSVGSRVVAAAARRAGVSRLVQESVTFHYADRGDEWITEDTEVGVSRAGEPVVLAETNALEFADAAHDAVVLRFGQIIGDDPLTRWQLGRARSGQAIGLGEPTGWAHVVHLDDIGGSVLAALAAPTGVYNVGADPVLRADLVAGFATAAGRDTLDFVPRLVQRLGGDRLEMLTRSHRVSSARFEQVAAWKPAEPEFDAGWLTGVGA